MCEHVTAIVQAPFAGYGNSARPTMRSYAVFGRRGARIARLLGYRHVTFLGLGVDWATVLRRKPSPDQQSSGRATHEPSRIIAAVAAFPTGVT